ncbi:MAG: SPOR domain-containing protein [Candidatus Zixiibacteriota bacterium]
MVTTRVIIVARALAWASLFAALATPSLLGDDPYSLIRRGHLAEAADSLSAVTSAATRDGNLLFCQSLLEKNGADAARTMQAALDASANPRYQEEIYLGLAQYYFIKQDPQQVIRVVGEYVTRFPASKYRAVLLRYAVAVDEQSRNYDAALKEIDRYLLAYKDGDDRQWGLIDKARIMQANDKTIGNLNMLKKLSQERSGPGVPLALFALATVAAEQKRTDEAVLNYNLLRDEFPNAIGIDLLEEQIGKLPPAQRDQTRAEVVTGTYYSVKAGVFSSPDNAQSFAARLKEFDKQVSVVVKTISGKTYHIVYVGRFGTFESAGQLKERLEKSFDETFQVVAR